MAFYRFSYTGHLSTGVIFDTGLCYHTVPPPLGDEPAPADVLAGIDGHLRTAFKACLQTGYTVDAAELRELVDLTSGEVPAAASLVVNQPGTLSGGTNTLPDACAAIIKLRSNAALRSGRGYMAMPGPRNASFLTDGQNYGGAYMTVLQAFAALLDDELDMGSSEPTHTFPIVYSRTRRSRGLDPFHFDVVEAIPSTRIRWRRTRTTAP